MDWREFLKPTKLKIILSLLLTGIISFFYKIPGHWYCTDPSCFEGITWGPDVPLFFGLLGGNVHYSQYETLLLLILIFSIPYIIISTYDKLKSKTRR